MFDSWQPIVAVVAAVLITYSIVLWLGIAFWTYRDIQERTRDGLTRAIALALVLLFNVPGLFLYLILRPRETLTEAYERRLEAEALKQELVDQRRSCSNCQRPVKEDFAFCPFCRSTLLEPCFGCGRGLDLQWAACPYCGAQQPRTATAVAAGPASTVTAPPPAPAAPSTGAARQAQPAGPPGDAAARTAGRSPRRAAPSPARQESASSPVTPASNPAPPSPQTGSPQ